MFKPHSECEQNSFIADTTQTRTNTHAHVGTWCDTCVMCVCRGKHNPVHPEEECPLPQKGSGAYALPADVNFYIPLFPQTALELQIN